MGIILASYTTCKHIEGDKPICDKSNGGSREDYGWTKVESNNHIGTESFYFKYHGHQMSIKYQELLTKDRIYFSLPIYFGYYEYNKVHAIEEMFSYHKPGNICTY